MSSFARDGAAPVSRLVATALLVLATGSTTSHSAFAQTGTARAVASDVGAGFASGYAEVEPGVRIHYVRAGKGGRCS